MSGTMNIDDYARLLDEQTNNGRLVDRGRVQFSDEALPLRTTIPSRTTLSALMTMIPLRLDAAPSMMASLPVSPGDRVEPWLGNAFTPACGPRISTDVCTLIFAVGL